MFSFASTKSQTAAHVKTCHRLVSKYIWCHKISAIYWIYQNFNSNQFLNFVWVKHVYQTCISPCWRGPYLGWTKAGQWDSESWNPHYFHSIVQRWVRNPYQDWRTNWKSGTSHHSTNPISLCLNQSGWCTKCASWYISLIVHLFAFEFTDVFSCHRTLKPVFQKKPKHTWMLFLSWHIWRTKWNKMCLKGGKLRGTLKQTSEWY